MLARRNGMPSSELARLSAKIALRVRNLPEVAEAKIVSTYVHKGSEVRTMQIITALLAGGKVVIIPVTDKVNRKLIFSELRNPERELEPGTFGILEPKREFIRPVPLEHAEVVLVPGVAWDTRGYRVGYGGGFYDRTINALRGHPVKIGLSYEFQIVNRILVTAYDRPVEKLVTEERVIAAAHNRSKQ